MFDVTSPKRCTDWNYPKVIRKCVVCGTWRGGKLRVRKEEHCQELTDMSWKSMLESPAWHDWLPSWQNIHRNVSHHCRWQPLKCQAGPVFVFLSKYFSLVLRTGDFANKQVLRTDHTHSVHYWSNRRTPLISRRILIVNYLLKSPSKQKIQYIKLLCPFWTFSLRPVISRVLSSVLWILVNINMKTVVIKIFNRLLQVTS